ncbi:hypothetical protein UB46_17210 [Burkholderiaceae bacterium 16]|nr:hypothetical protein UB46_17210 [Burkholderiaceae bacterium 16]
MIGNHRVRRQAGEFDDLVDAHDDVATHIESRTSGGYDADLRAMVRNELPDRWREYGIAAQVEAGLIRHLDQIADPVLHQLADQATAVRAANRANPTAHEGVGLPMRFRQRLDIQSAFGQMAGIVRCADDRKLPIAQPIFGRAIQMIEMTFLAMRYQAMGDRLKRCRSGFG